MVSRTAKSLLLSRETIPLLLLTIEEWAVAETVEALHDAVFGNPLNVPKHTSSGINSFSYQNYLHEIITNTVLLVILNLWRVPNKLLLYIVINSIPWVGFAIFTLGNNMLSGTKLLTQFSSSKGICRWVFLGSLNVMLFLGSDKFILFKIKLTN